MIKVVAKNIVKADKVEAYINLAKTLVEETNQKDKGCISYDLYQDLSNPQILTFIEEWNDMEALQNHMAAPHFKEIVPKLGAFSDGPEDVHIYSKAIQ